MVNHNFVKSATHAACQTLRSRKLAVTHSHVLETVAALLGYRTYAALSAEGNSATNDYSLEDAELFVLNKELGEERTRELGITEEHRDAVVAACIEGLKVCAGVKVFVGVTEFYEEHAREELSQVLSEADDTSAAMAETNAGFFDGPDMEDSCEPTEDLWATREFWSITANGTMSGEYDPDADRPYTGDTLLGYAKITYQKAGRAGLIYMDGEGGAGVDDSWREEDHEAELRDRAQMARDDSGKGSNLDPMN